MTAGAMDSSAGLKAMDFNAPQGAMTGALPAA